MLRLYSRLPAADRSVSDGGQVEAWRPQGRHVGRKGRETNRNAGLPAVLRGKLNWLTRRTKGSSTSAALLRRSIALVCLQQAWI